MYVEMQSVQSLLIRPMRDGHPVALGTAFVVKYGDQPYLITNRHNVTGRDALNNPIRPDAVMPHGLTILHNAAGKLGEWVPVVEDLYSEPGVPRWLEHPDYGRKVDVVALPLLRPNGVEFFPYDAAEAERTNIAVRVATDLSIIGFPFGITAGGAMGVWSRGTVATEPDIDFDGLPSILIDSRTRKGQSGSPVIFYANGRSLVTKDGGTIMTSGTTSFLVGIYSGRVNDESDLGIVWKARVIPEILIGGSLATGESLLPE